MTATTTIHMHACMQWRKHFSLPPQATQNSTFGLWFTWSCKRERPAYLSLVCKHHTEPGALAWAPMRFSFGCVTRCSEPGLDQHQSISQPWLQHLSEASAQRLCSQHPGADRLWCSSTQTHESLGWCQARQPFVQCSHQCLSGHWPLVGWISSTVFGLHPTCVYNWWFSCFCCKGCLMSCKKSPLKLCIHSANRPICFIVYLCIIYTKAHPKDKADFVDVLSALAYSLVW